MAEATAAVAWKRKRGEAEEEALHKTLMDDYC